MGRFDERRTAWSDLEPTALDDLKEEVVELGLEYSLVTRWTAFVAVSEAIVTEDPGATTNSAVPTAMVEGVGYGTSFAGSATPEPATWIGLLLAGGLVRASRRRRRR
jgi:Ca-activated chloride channel family protein